MQESVQKIFQEALKIVPFDGWAHDLPEKASIAAGLDPAAGRIYFPGGRDELLEYFINWIDQQMLELFKQNDLSKLRTHERIRLCIISRILILQQYKSIIRRTISFFAIPFNIVMATKTLWKTVDLIWYEAGYDQSTDFNYYTKRLSLGAIYSSTIFYWLSDESDGSIDTIDFLDRCLQGLMKIKRK